jgi:DNA helicase HerA-like ATPase
MLQENIGIGKIVKIDGLNITIEIAREQDIRKILLQWNIKDYLVSIHKYVFAFLPNNRKIIARITKVFDKDLFKTDNIYDKENPKYLIEANLTAIYDDFTEKLDTGINTFPIIGTEVFVLDNKVYKQLLTVTSDYKLEIGQSFVDESLKVTANPDILFGKHLGVFGNTGTGKSCTVASIIQGLKRRVYDKSNSKISVNPKVIIFDANNEYKKAFENTEFSVKYISKTEIKLPHSALSMSEYIQFFEASSGVQAPVLTEAIENLKGKKDFFDLDKLCPKIENIVTEKAEGNNFSYSQWRGWVSTMLNRINRVTANIELKDIINSEENIVDNILDSVDEITIIEADFDRKELDILIFIFSKLLYRRAVRDKGKKNIVVVFEEAHRYINESDTEDYSLGNYYIERLAREGRKFCLSLIISSQRPSELSKTVLSQCNSFIIHRITNKNDLEFVSKVVRADNVELLKVIPGLERQYAITTGEAFSYSDIVKIANADPVTDSKDPEVIGNWSTPEKIVAEATQKIIVNE